MQVSLLISLQQWDAVFLLANGTINNEALYMFGYQAHHEMSTIGKAFTKNFFSMNSTKLYSYYQACSEGGREGWSQVQRFGDEWDGAIIGAPAFRYGQQQVNHLVQNVVEKTLGYYPPPCEFAKIVNATIDACDAMDGLTDGVVSRSDLCKLNFNINSTIGLPYYCAASAATTGFGKRQFPSAATPVQNGTVSAEGVAVAAKILDGLKTTDGKRAYLPYQYAADFDDGATAYDSTTDTWGLSISGLGAEWVVRYLELLDSSSFSGNSFDNVTYDTLRDWMLVCTLLSPKIIIEEIDKVSKQETRLTIHVGGLATI
jgi:tannase